jgi:nucleoside-diphosphate-sugar epimerase
LNNDFCFRITKARRELGYEPHVGVDEAIRRTAEWYIPLVRGKNKP